MKSNYNVVAVFNKGGWSEVHEAHVPSCCITPDHCFRPDHNNKRGTLPVHGAPTRAKDTLLAQMLRANCKTASLLLGGRLGKYDEYDTRNAVHYAKHEFFPADYTSGRKINPITCKSLVGRLISVEVECYLRDVPDDRIGMSVVYDGSISDSYNRTAREIRKVAWASNGRLTGLLGLRKYLEGAKVDRKCGLHVHVDARHLPKDETHPELHSAAETHRRIVCMQKMLKRLIPRSRWSNRYCRFAYNGPLLSPPGVPSRRHDRYCAINWESYSEHGTIEFRCGSGSVNPVKIESWALLCQHLLNIASRKDRALPTNWKQLLATMPQWMASWCVLRYMKLHGGLECIDSRTASAVDADLPDNIASCE